MVPDFLSLRCGPLCTVIHGSTVGSCLLTTLRQFRHDFRRGLGSALLELGTNSQPERFASVVRQGCLELWGYDYQCEPDRGWYLAQCLTLADADGTQAVVERFEQPVADDWLFVQLTETLSHLARDGRHEALAALRSAQKRWAGQPSGTLDRFGAVSSALLSIDGWRVVEAVADEVRHGRAAVIDLESFWFHAQKMFGRERVDPVVVALPGAPDQTASHQLADVDQSLSTRPAPTLAQTLAKVVGPLRRPDGSVVYRGRGAVMQFVRTAGADDIDRLARTALAETEIGKKAELVFGMKRATYAWPAETLESWTTSRSHLLRDAAFQIMANNPEPRWRDLALSLIDRGTDVGQAVCLLASSGLPSDADTLLVAVRSLVIRQSDGLWHGAFWSVQEAVEAGRWPHAGPLLDQLYRKTLCPGCRYRVVRTMAERGVLSDRVADEALYDSVSQTRELAARLRTPAGRSFVQHAERQSVPRAKAASRSWRE